MPHWLWSILAAFQLLEETLGGQLVRNALIEKRFGFELHRREKPRGLEKCFVGRHITDLVIPRAKNAKGARLGNHFSRPFALLACCARDIPDL